ncbi:MAG: DNA (cytosine-5-)-methyltransferase [Firmicutes bacterium]|uniref:DNA (cytosine-5-)-methyltransferase n=1 Tax=Candidatus Scatoplasma merdavium TaxID=2840932 RepID=A0A9D9D9E8_9BACL|nr:DNA (cytosine-5-)-methyltransferase [Candidatus Scatoplasma merdavium]
MKKTVIELFAGVGGFRVGLNNIEIIDENGHAIENGDWSFVWANQWEPATKSQEAFECYNTRFNESNNSNVDISQVNKNDIPDHTLLCGGFPCQDYSVARSLSQEKGIEGKKGVLWWQIRDILKAKHSPFVLLENVDRLLKSPSKQRGRDFGIMLKCLNDLGYAVEWRVINAADYGHPQRRRRTYIFAYNKKTNYYKQTKQLTPFQIIFEKGIFAKSFSIVKHENDIKEISLLKYDDLVDFSDNFAASFETSGYMINGKVYTHKAEPILEKPITLANIVIRDGVDKKYYLSDEQIKKFEYLRGSKKIKRIDKNGFEYTYSEGAMSENDSLDLPGRTMLTSEGTINRSTHVILDPKTKKLRLLTPIECERLNQFPDNWTNTGMSDKRRYFMMGNALVCGIIKKLGKIIETIVDGEE